MALRSSRRFISKNNIKSGMLVEFSYKKIKDGGTGSYMILVIDPNKINESNDNKHLHGILIDDLSDDDLMELVSVLGDDKPNLDIRTAPLANLQSTEAYNRYLNTNKSKRIYRTFVVDNISNLRQILIGRLND
jgi:hypothetical protein